MGLYSDILEGIWLIRNFFPSRAIAGRMAPLMASPKNGKCCFALSYSSAFKERIPSGYFSYEIKMTFETNLEVKMLTLIY